METLCRKTPLGDVTLFAEDGALVALDWGQGADAPRTTTSPVLNQAAEALATYFAGGDADFSALPLKPHGTAFQQRVWRALGKIKAGQTKTYGQLAKALKSGPRAVGAACGANPLPIFIPCHRVLGAKGQLGGYSALGGTDTKAFLLRLEGARG